MLIDSAATIESFVSLPAYMDMYVYIYIYIIYYRMLLTQQSLPRNKF